MTAPYDQDADEGNVIQLRPIHPSLLPRHRPSRIRRLLDALRRRPRLSWFRMCDYCGSCRPERGYCPGCCTR